MGIYIKNADTVEHKWAGQYVQPGEYYLIELVEKTTWQHDSTLLVAIANSQAVVAKTNDGLEDISDINEAIEYLKNDEAKNVFVEGSPAFAQKILPDGRKLFRRKHGIRQLCAASETTLIQFPVPYPQCKVDEVEVINCSGNDNVDLLIKDTATNTYSGAPVETVGPNYLLNQFGFNVCVSDLYYSDSSNYDADLYYGMIIEVAYHNNEAEEKNIGINIVLHEVKD